MTVDFSPPKKTLSEDIQSLVDDLSASAASWVPELFPYGTKQSRDWRLGSLEGEKGGSTSIRLYGDKAGCFIDHANDCAKGGPLELIKVAYGCDFKTAILKAQDILRKPRPITKAALDDKVILARDNQKVHKLWKLCVQTERVIVEEYFAKRGIDLSLFGDVEDAAVLLHYPSQRFFPAVVAAIRGPLGGMIAVHRTYVDPDSATKADVTPSKMILGSCKGGAVMLTPRGDSKILGLAEGIETAMSAHILNPTIPVWSVLSTSGLVNFEPVDGIEEYRIFADNDAPGIEAANKLKNKLAKAGCSVTIVIPSGEGCKDFNDQLLFKQDKE